MSTHVLLPFSTDLVLGPVHDRVGFSTYPECLRTDDQDNSYVLFVGDAEIQEEFTTDHPAGLAYNGVTLSAAYKYVGPGAYAGAKIRLYLSINDVKYYGDYENASSTTWATLSKAWPLNPETSVDWNLSEINALRAGLEFSDAGSNGIRFSYFPIVSDYDSEAITPATPLPTPPIAGGSAYTPAWLGTYSQESDPTADSGGVFTFDRHGNIKEFEVPDGITGINGKTSFARWAYGDQRRIYMNGGHTENIVFLEPGRVSRLGISVIANTLVDDPSPTGNDIGVQLAGTGLTGEVIVYLRWRDTASNRRSPLSEGLSMGTMTDDGLAFENVPSGPDIDDAFVDSIEVWVSVDGGLPRHLESFAIPDATFSTSNGNDDLGAAEEESFIDFPLCKFNAIYHDRLIMSGDPAEPQRIYFSLRADMEAYGGLYLDTKQGESVRGIYVVRDTLIVQCDNSHYGIQGYSSDDIEMFTLSPSIGGLGHHTVTLVDDVAIFPARSGWYLNNGSTLVPLGVGDFNETWAREQHWTLFEGSRRSWCVHDSENRVIKFKTPTGTQFSPAAGLAPANDSGIMWIIDYRDLVTGAGGVNLSIDTVAGTRETEPTASAMLPNDDGSVHLYTGFASGKIAMDNVFGMNDIDHNYEYVWQTAQEEIAKPGDDDDAAAVVKAWLYMMNEDVPIEWTLFAGNQYDWQAQKITGQTGGRTISGTIEAAMEAIGDFVRVYRDRVLVDTNQAAGSTVGIMLKKPADTVNIKHPAYRGAAFRSDGAVFLAPTFSVRGWGYSYKGFGTEARSLRPYDESIVTSD